MKHKIVKGAIVFLIMACCAGGGYLTGSQNTDNSENEVKQAEVPKKNKQIKQNTQTKYDAQLTAVVNLDGGISGSQGSSGYSQALLSTLDIPYEITGLEAAKQGLDNGKYSAYLVIPGTFSETVETINTTPQKAILQYAISPKLTEEKRGTRIHGRDREGNTEGKGT